jgi:hypothetical protein
MFEQLARQHARSRAGANQRFCGHARDEKIADGLRCV